ncbi:WXG100 family type VII secretion target [Amycolatopsis lurida]
MGQPQGENSIIAAAKENTEAEKTPLKSALQGTGLAQDLLGGGEQLFKGDWTEGLLSMAAGGLDVGMKFKDIKGGGNPIEILTSMGLGWVIEHLSPMKDWLDQLTGNQDELDLTIQTWAEISKQVQATAEDLNTTVQQDCATWSGTSADRYREYIQRRLDALVKLSDDAKSGAGLIDVAKTVLAVVRNLIRDLITEVCAKLIYILARYPPPAYPAALAAEGMPMIVSKSQEGMSLLQKLMRVWRRFLDLLADVGIRMKETAKTFITENYEMFGAKDLGMRVGTEIFKEGGKKVFGEQGKGITAGITGSTEHDDQAASGETPEKRQHDQKMTRVFPASNPETTQTWTGRLD